MYMYVLHVFVLYCTVLYCSTVLYCTVLYNAVLSTTVHTCRDYNFIYNIVYIRTCTCMYYMYLYYTVLCCTVVLYCTVLYCTVLYNAVLSTIVHTCRDYNFIVYIRTCTLYNKSISISFLCRLH